MRGFDIPAVAAHWTRTVLLLGAALLLGLLLALGCGGNTDAGPPGVHPTLTVNWPARSRDVTAPGSAMSFQVTVTALKAGATPQSAVFNRGNTSSAFRQTYTLPFAVPAGSYGVSILFEPLEDATSNPLSTPVGAAAGEANLSSNQPSLGGYSMTGLVASVAVFSGQTVPVGGSIGLNAAAYSTSTPNPFDDLVVTPGSIFWTVVSSSGSMSVSADGAVSATAPGTITVTATVDGIVSPAQTVTSYSAAPVSGCSDSTYTPNYVSEMTTSENPLYAGVLRHWPSFPVTVAVVSNASLTPAFQSMAQQGLSAWTNATAGQATFTLVSANQSPDVTITFEPSSLIAPGQDGVVGATSVFASASDASVLSHVDVLVGSDLTDNAETINTVTHELGHALGIGGHSTVDQDLMFPYLNDDFAPTSDDVNTLFTGYCGSFVQNALQTRAARAPRSARPIVIVDTTGSK